MLMVRVGVALIFGSFALWAQAPEASSLALPLFLTDSASLSSNENALVIEKSHLQPDGIVPRFSLSERSAPPLRFEIDPAQAPASRPRAARVSRGFEIRRKIHKYASIATLPLFISEAIVGQKLFNRTTSESDSLRGAHSALAAGIGVLFGVNSVTGVWNMMETRRAPHSGKRLFHGILMLAADAGFVVTAATAPHRERGVITNSNDASTHRAIAFTSFGVATVGYVYMLVTR